MINRLGKCGLTEFTFGITDIKRSVPSNAIRAFAASANTTMAPPVTVCSINSINSSRHVKRFME